MLIASGVYADQTAAREHLARGHRLWNQRFAGSAIAAFEAATRDTATAAEAWEALGRIYMFKGWQQEGVFPGWHDEPEFRDKAIAAFKASLAADAGRASAMEALKQAETFAASPTVVPPAPSRAEVKALDDTLEALRADKSASADTVLAAVEARAAAQADPAPFITGAQILLDRGALDAAVTLALRGEKAATVFVRENESAYKMSGKSEGLLARSRASSQDTIGWAAFLRKDYATAATRLEEAERLSRGADFTNQVHLGALAEAKNDRDGAREHYLNALSLAGGPAPLRQATTEKLRNLPSNGTSASSFDAWLEEELSRRTEARRASALRSPIDRQLPALALTGLDGRRVEVAALRGKVLLLNFFSSW